MDWKRLTFFDWFTGILVAAGFFGYGIYCIVMQEGVFYIPFQSRMGTSSPEPMNVFGTAAVRTGISYLIWAAFFHFGGIWKTYRRIDRETWGKIAMALFATGVLSLLWALFSM